MVLIVVTVLYGLFLLFKTINLFPYTNLYFNELAGNPKKIPYQFDYDYWDTTYKSAAEYFSKEIIPNHKPEGSAVSVYSCGARTALDYYLQDQIVQKKNPADAEYVICDPIGYSRLNSHFNILTTIEKSGVPVIVISTR